jgi:carbamoylphosphate synthase small subunit
MTQPQKAHLVLADGTVFEGVAVGAAGTTIGEAVFTTGMTGYQEVLTDPSYCGQIVVMTAPQIGNTGTNDEDEEAGRPHLAGFVMHELSSRVSNWRASRSLDAYLKRARHREHRGPRHARADAPPARSRRPDGRDRHRASRSAACTRRRRHLR